MINPAVLLVFCLILVWAVHEVVQARTIEWEMKEQIKLIHEIRESMIKRDQMNGVLCGRGISKEIKELFEE